MRYKKWTNGKEVMVVGIKNSRNLNKEEKCAQTKVAVKDSDY